MLRALNAKDREKAKDRRWSPSIQFSYPTMCKSDQTDIDPSIHHQQYTRGGCHLNNSHNQLKTTSQMVIMFNDKEGILIAAEAIQCIVAGLWGNTFSAPSEFRQLQMSNLSLQRQNGKKSKTHLCSS